MLFWIASILSDIGQRGISRLKKLKAIDNTLILRFYQIFVYFITFLVFMDLMNIDLTALAVFGGALAVGIGLGLQKVSSNFLSGIILLFEKSLRKNDLVELNGAYGFVRYVGARYTLIETLEGREISVPNEDFMTNKVTNWTYSSPKGRVEIQVGVSYSSDLDKVQQVLLKAAKENPFCIEDPEPACYLREYGDSAVQFVLFFWVANVADGLFKIKSEVMFNVWRKFHEEGIVIPFPQRDLHIKSGFTPPDSNKQKGT